MPQLVCIILYGLAEMALRGVETYSRLHLLVFYTLAVGLSPRSVVFGLAATLAWDAAAYPYIGKISDHFKRSRGTRMHLFLLGAILTALSLVALFHPPRVENEFGQWLLFFLLSLTFSTAFALLSISNATLVDEFSDQLNTQVEFMGWRHGFSHLGSLIGIAVPGYYLLQDVSRAHENVTWTLAMSVLLTGFLISLVPRASAGRKPPVQPSIQQLPAKNGKLKTAWPLFLGFSFLQIGLALFSALTLYFCRLSLGASDPDIQTAVIAFFAAAGVGFPLWNWLAKKPARAKFAIGLILFTGFFFALLFGTLPVSQLPLASASGAAGFATGSFLLVEAVFLEYFHSGNLGFHFGLWKFCAKFCHFAGLFLVSFLLDWANVAFPDIDTPQRLTWLFGPGVGGFFIAAGLSLFLLLMLRRTHPIFPNHSENSKHGANFPEFSSQGPRPGA